MSDWLFIGIKARVRLRAILFSRIVVSIIAEMSDIGHSMPELRLIKTEMKDCGKLSIPKTSRYQETAC